MAVTQDLVNSEAIHPALTLSVCVCVCQGPCKVEVHRKVLRSSLKTVCVCVCVCVPAVKPMSAVLVCVGSAFHYVFELLTIFENVKVCVCFGA